MLTVLIIKNIHILAGTYYISLENGLDKPERFSIPNLDLNWKYRKSSYQERQILALACKFVFLILG